MPLTKERNPEKLKNMCLYCDRTVDNPCYLDKDTPTQQERTCPLRPMDFREENRADKKYGYCNFCLSDDGTCHLSNDEFSSESDKNKHCQMRPLSQIYPIIKSSERRRIMNRIDKYKAFFMQHGKNIVFMSGINAEGSSGGIGTGSNTIMDIVNPVGGYDDSQPEEVVEDIGGTTANINGVRRRGRPSKQDEKERARKELIRKGILEDEGEATTTKKRGRGRPPKSENVVGEEKKKRGRPSKGEGEKKKEKVVNTKKSPGDTTSLIMNRLMKKRG